MKMIQLTCPDCGAPLEAESDRKFFFCSYCGKKIVLDDERQKVEIENAREAGYEFERGRMEARDDNPRGLELAEQIEYLIEPVRTLGYTIDEEQRLADKSTGLENSLRDALSWKAKALTVLWPVVFFIGVFVFIVPADYVIVGLFLDVVAAVLLFFGLRRSNQKKIVSLRKSIRENTQDRRDLQEQIDEIEAAYDFSFIPEEYRHEDAMEYFCSALNSTRALNLKQAISLYEDHLKHEQEKEWQRQQIEMQQRQIEALRRDVEAARYRK